MKLLALGLSLGVSAKGVKQAMVENRLKFDRDILAHGDGFKGFDYDDWDPYLDLDDDELEALLRKLHTHMDSSQDGFVDEEEILVWSLVAIFNMNGREATEDWDLIDFGEVEHSESVEATWDDIIEELHSFRFSGEHKEIFDPNDKQFNDYNKLYNRDRARFVAADLDNNGALSKVEFHLFSNPLKDETIKNSVIDEALSHVDTNKDGKLDLDEYLADWYQAPNHVTEAALTVAKHDFEDIDRNSNGLIDGAEFIFWISPENTEMAIDEAGHLMVMCDENDDDLLTAEEIIDETELWLDSAGTEYGETLRYMDELR